MNDSSLPPVSDAALPPAGQKQSKLGVAAFIVSLVGVLVFCVAVMLSAVYGASVGLSNPAAAQNPFQAIDPSSPLMVASSILSWCGPLLNFIALIMGIVALLQKDVKKTLAVVAVILSGLVVLSFCGLTIIGFLGQLASL